MIPKPMLKLFTIWLDIEFSRDKNVSDRIKYMIDFTRLFRERIKMDTIEQHKQIFRQHLKKCIEILKN